MIRGTTPLITLAVDGDCTGVGVYVTFKSNGVRVTKGRADFESAEYDPYANRTSISLRLTQEESLGFLPGTDLKVQVDLVDGGRRYASNIAALPVEAVLANVVLP